MRQRGPDGDAVAVRTRGACASSFRPALPAFSLRRRACPAPARQFGISLLYLPFLWRTPRFFMKLADGVEPSINVMVLEQVQGNTPENYLRDVGQLSRETADLDTLDKLYDDVKSKYEALVNLACMWTNEGLFAEDDRPLPVQSPTTDALNAEAGANIIAPASCFVCGESGARPYAS